MSAPPPNADASELFALLTKVPKPSKLIDCPRKDPVTGAPLFQIALVPLTEAELMACRAAAEAYARMMLDDRDKAKTPGDSLGYRDLYVNAVYVELLCRACRDPKFPKLHVPVWISAQQLRQSLFPDEISVLFEAYNIWQVEAGPIISRMSEEEMEAWIALLAKGASRVPLAALSSEGKNGLLLHMASRIASYSTATFSPGLPADVLPTAPDGEAPPASPVADG